MFLGNCQGFLLRKTVIVKIGSPLNLTREVFKGLKLEENDLPDEIFKYHLMVKGSNPSPENEYTKKTIVENDIELVPYHLITISGKMKDSFYVVPGTLSNLDDLKEYLGSNDYAVGDDDTREVLDKSSPITRDMRIIVMPRNVVVIDIEKGKPGEEVNKTEIAVSISDLTGIDIKDILVGAEVDEEGHAIRVIVVLNDSDMCVIVETAINNLVKDDTCHYGILCRSTGAHILVNDQTLSLTNRNSVAYSILLFMMVLVML